MELTFSPDVDARWCYALVFVGGMVSAGWQVHGRVKAYRGAWSVPRTWLAYLAFVPVPVALFWLLDRISVMQDTSVFGAFIVGLAYDRILAGGMSSVKAPAGLGGIWKSVSGWADGIQQVVLDNTGRNTKRFHQRIITGLIQDKDKLEKLEQLVRIDADPEDETFKKLKEVLEGPEGDDKSDADAKPETDIRRQRKARELFDFFKKKADFEYALKSHKVISKWTYLRYQWDLSSKLIAVPIIVALLAVPALALWQLNQDETRLTYYAWRIRKQNSTVLDQHRSGRELAQFLADGAHAAEARKKLSRVLERPGVPIERVDKVLGVLIETRRAVDGQTDSLAMQLIDGLRTASLDARARIHHTLMFLAGERLENTDVETPTELENWSAADNNSAVEIEKHVDRWKEFWTTLPTPANRPAAFET